MVGFDTDDVPKDGLVKKMLPACFYVVYCIHEYRFNTTGKEYYSKYLQARDISIDNINKALGRW